jgi:ATP-dependent Clp protease ATP-binding subunit ClpX
MKYIFLDFDGVLNTEKHQEFLRSYNQKTFDSYGPLFDPSAVECLSSIVTNVSDARIVIISSWKFEGLDKIIERRQGNQTVGFSSEIKKKEERKKKGIFKDVVPHDIVKFGLIPELVGRIPVTVTLDDLDKEALVRIISEPKNSLINQYVKLIEMDGVNLNFENEALTAIASLAIERNTGARGLRSIMENLMMNIMYEIPSRSDVTDVVITEGCVNGSEKPEYILKEAIDFDKMVMPAEISGELN